MQEIESKQTRCAPRSGICRGLDLGEARLSGVVHARELAVEIGGLRVQARERDNGAQIFVNPVKPSSGQELHG
jgi:hypothetical protein